MNEPDESTVDRPLTRRELREREAAAQETAERSATAHHADPQVESAAEATGGEEARWSLYGRLPRELPAEPEDDDVQWDFFGQGHSSVDQTVRLTASERAQALGETEAGTEPTTTGGVPQRISAWPVAEPTTPRFEPLEPVGRSKPVVRFEPVVRSEPVVQRVPTGDSVVRPTPVVRRAPTAEPDSEPEAAGLISEVPQTAPRELPTLSDLMAARPAPAAGPAERGWRGLVRRVSGGRIGLEPDTREIEHRSAVASVQRSLNGPRTVVVINPKGGAHKTTATLLLAATFGQLRGGYTLAWDNNETRGTLGWRARQSYHQNTAVNLLTDLERFADPGAARVGDLDNYVRSQGPAQFDVLASDEDAASAASIDGFAFRSMHRTLARFYRLMIVDTGNNMRASNWQAAVDAADQVVIVSTVREDTAQSAAWAIDALRATGREDAVRSAVTVLSDPAPQHDPELAGRLRDHFGRLTRTVIDVPYDKSLVGGAPVDFDGLSHSTRDAWLWVAAAVADEL